MRGAALLPLLAALPAAAEEGAPHPAYREAARLGMLIASEGFCGLRYAPGATDALVAAKAPPGDDRFAGYVALLASGSQYTLTAIEGDWKAEHCAAIAADARHYGVLQ